MVVLSLWFYVSENNTSIKGSILFYMRETIKKVNRSHIFLVKEKKKEKSFNKINHCDSYVLKTKKYKVQKGYGLYERHKTTVHSMNENVPRLYITI